MCFSATASFAASAVLGGAGVATVGQVKKKEDLFLAMIPVLFAIQQFLEGLIWIFPDSGTLTRALGYGFLFFAFLLWPTYAPLATWSHETQPKRKDLLKKLLIIGLFESFYLLVVLGSHPLSVEIIDKHVCYTTGLPFQAPVIVLYLLVTIGAFLCSSKKFLQRFGVIILLSAMIAGQFYTQAFTSVWCFFAAGLSILLCGYFYRKSQDGEYGSV